MDENNKEEELYHSQGPSYTITRATVDDRGIYSCFSAEWGTWGTRRYSLVNVIGELTDKSLLNKTKKNCVNIEGEGRGGCGLNFEEGGAPVMV